MTIREADGTVVYDSGSILDVQANEREVYDDGRRTRVWNRRVSR